MADDHDVSATLNKLQSLLAEKKLIVFDEHEAEALREVAAFWVSFHRVGRLILWLRHPLKFVGYAGGAYIAFKTGGIAEIFKGMFK